MRNGYGAELMMVENSEISKARCSGKGVNELDHDESQRSIAKSCSEFFLNMITLVASKGDDYGKGLSSTSGKRLSRRAR